jgi:hypothetical protein
MTSNASIRRCAVVIARGSKPADVGFAFCSCERNIACSNTNVISEPTTEIGTIVNA